MKRACVRACVYVCACVRVSCLFVVGFFCVGVFLWVFFFFGGGGLGEGDHTRKCVRQR